MYLLRKVPVTAFVPLFLRVSEFNAVHVERFFKLYIIKKRKQIE